MLRLILIIVLIYLTYQVIIKPIMGILMQYTLRKFIDDQMKNNPGRSNTQPRKPEGSINIDYIPKEKKSNSKDHDDEGEYVDYEEVK